MSESVLQRSSRVDSDRNIVVGNIVLDRVVRRHATSSPQGHFRANWVQLDRRLMFGALRLALMDEGSEDGY